MDAWLTLAIAFLAACFAGMQWFVARQQFILELFDRRFTAYNAVLNSMRPILGKGDADDNDLNEFKIAALNSKFLFGSDVNFYLDEILKTIVSLKYGNTIYNSQTPSATKASDIIFKANTEIIEFFDKYPKLCQPYMIMPQKRVRTPVEWFSDLTNLSKNYGGEPPKV